MKYGIPVTLVCAAMAAVGPIHHAHLERDCNRHIELCPSSEMFYAPDDPAPENAPPTIFTLPTTAYTSSAPSTRPSVARLRVNDVAAGCPHSGLSDS